MYKFLLFTFLLVTVGLIVLIVCQQGKDAYMHVSSSGSDFSGVFSEIKNSGNFLSKMTSVFSVLFFVLSLVMNNYYLSVQEKKEKNFLKEQEFLEERNQKT